jgi:hypothetical protein
LPKWFACWFQSSSSQFLCFYPLQVQFSTQGIMANLFGFLWSYPLYYCATEN